MLHETIGPRDPVALLVDGENFPIGHAAKLADVTQLLGPVTVQRVYGKLEQIRLWDDHGYRLCPTRPGKNSADMLLCVQAMRLALHDGFKTIVLASSDRDFTYLAEELRERGVAVIGVGGPTAVLSFRNTCARFVELHSAEKESVAKLPAPVTATVEPAATTKKFPSTKIVPLIRNLLVESSFEGKWGYLRWIEARLKKIDKEFNPEDYGHKTFESLVRSANHFRVETLDGKVRIQDPFPKGSGSAQQTCSKSLPVFGPI